MAKQLTIIRHAKSTASNSQSDHDRPLNARGKSDSKLIGKFLSAQGYMLEQAYCSTAVRARQTFEILNEFLEIQNDHVIFDDAMYLASLPTLISHIESLPNTYDWVAMVGHNPTLTEMCNSLCNGGLENLPTGGAYTIRFPVDDWRAVGIGTGEHLKLVTPRMLKDYLSNL